MDSMNSHPVCLGFHLLNALQYEDRQLEPPMLPHERQSLREAVRVHRRHLNHLAKEPWVPPGMLQISTEEKEYVAEERLKVSMESLCCKKMSPIRGIQKKADQRQIPLWTRTPTNILRSDPQSKQLETLYLQCKALLAGGVVQL